MRALDNHGCQRTGCRQNRGAGDAIAGLYIELVGKVFRVRQDFEFQELNRRGGKNIDERQ